MADFLPQLARVLARYLAMFLMTIGFIAPESAPSWASDPQVLGFIGAALSALTEFLWAQALRRGWVK